LTTKARHRVVFTALPVKCRVWNSSGVPAFTAESAVDMTDRNEYWRKAEKYEEQAKLVRDAWVKQRLRVLARHWREAAEQEESSRESSRSDDMNS
jgi:hypothetical protein